MQINSNALGLNVSIPPGKYVVDKAGRKINDPRLDKLCGDGGLTKEMGDPVPLLVIDTAANTTPKAGFSGSNAPLPRPQMAPVPQAPVKSQRPDIPSSPSVLVTSVAPKPGPTSAEIAADAGKPAIRGYTMDQARKLGLVRPTRVVPEGVTDTDQPSVPGATPHLEIASDLGPAATAKLVLPPDAKRDGVAAQAAGASDAESPTIINETLARAGQAAEPIVIHDQPEAGQPGPAVTTAKKADKAKKTDRKGKEKTFVCSADNKRFVYRSELLRWAEKHHADKVAAIMAPYPA